MTFIEQPIPSNCCGQACVAMIANVTIAESIKAFGKKGGTYSKDVISALQALGIKCDDKLVRISKSNPKSDYCMVTVLSKSSKKYKHWVVFKDGVYYDPALGISEDLNEAHYNPNKDGWWKHDYERHEASFLPIYT